MTTLIATDHYPTRVPEPAEMTRPDPAVWGSGRDGPLRTEALDSFGRDGFLAVDSLLPEGEMHRYQQEIDRLARDPGVRADERTVIEQKSDEVRSIFEVHKSSRVFAELVADPRLADAARQILGSDVYVHQSRVNYKPGFQGAGFYWHSDFETWHAEDGMPRPRALSISIALTPNYVHNGGLMIMPGSHRTYVSCVGETPSGHHKQSLRNEGAQIGMPDQDTLARLAHRHGIELFTGEVGSATIFDSNCMHASSNNVTPFPRSNIFIVFNSVDNTLVEPYAAPQPRPPYIASRDFTPVG